MKQKAYVVLMAGGTGTRFWPYSTVDHPKQFLDILGTGKSLLEMTVQRFMAIVPFENIFISTNERYEDLVKEQLPSLGQDQLLLEPAKLNTAPCIAYACFKIAARNPDAPIIISPCDHAIFNDSAFHAAIELACKSVDEKNLVTIGIKPTRPSTGYGYINYESSDSKLKKVKSFIEKPSFEQAKKLLASNDYVWNAGIFVWSAQAIKSAYYEYLPDIHKMFDAMASIYFTQGERQRIKKEYSQLSEISIDYGILEKSENVHVIPGEFDWSDLGSWGSLHEYMKNNEINNNVIKGEVKAYEVENSLIMAQSGKMTIVQGLDGYAVIDTPDALLICEKYNKKVLTDAIAEIRQDGKEKYL